VERPSCPVSVGAERVTRSFDIKRETFFFFCKQYIMQGPDGAAGTAEAYWPVGIDRLCDEPWLIRQTRFGGVVGHGVAGPRICMARALLHNTPPLRPSACKLRELPSNIGRAINHAWPHSSSVSPYLLTRVGTGPLMAQWFANDVGPRSGDGWDSVSSLLASVTAPTSSFLIQPGTLNAARHLIQMQIAS
jgi:hypothetical protein